MKIKKIIAGVAAAAMACTTMAAMSVSAISTGVVDFEDGDCSFVYMNDLDGGSKATISVEDYNGSKALKITPENSNLYTKIWFDLDSMMDRAVATEIAKVEFDVSMVPTQEDGIIDWVGLQIGSAGGFDRTGADIQGSQADPKWTDKSAEVTIPYDDFGNLATGPATGKVSRSWLMKNEKYTLTGTNPFMAVMINPGTGASRVGSFVIYIDNIKFMDAKGNTLTMGVTPAAAETEAAPEETTAAPAETEAAPVETTAAPVEAADDDEVVAVADDVDVAPAPAETEAPVVTEAPAPAAPVADTTTTPAATGNVAVASIAAVMAVAGAAAIAAKKRK